MAIARPKPPLQSPRKKKINKFKKKKKKKKKTDVDGIKDVPEATAASSPPAEGVAKPAEPTLAMHVASTPSEEPTTQEVVPKKKTNKFKKKKKKKKKQVEGV